MPKQRIACSRANRLPALLVGTASANSGDDIGRVGHGGKRTYN